MADKEQVIQALRATLISVKGAITIKQCNRDYRELQGEWIPFKKLGYPSLEKLFLDVPGFKVIQSNGEWYVDAIASKETQHIAAMVSRQKPSKKSSSGLNRLPRKQGSWRKPVSSYTPSYNSQYSNQYYRPNSGTTSQTNNNNYKAVRYNYRTNDTRSAAAPTAVYPAPPKAVQPAAPKAVQPAAPKAVQPAAPKPQAKTSTHSFESNAPKSTSSLTPPLHDVPASTTEAQQSKHSVRTSAESNGKCSASSAKVSASQRLSNLRDRLNTVDLIPLQLPAATNECVVGNKYESSGPVSYVTPAYSLEPPPDSTSSVAKLEWTCKKLGLQQPVYKVHDIRPKRGPIDYHCHVKVGASCSASSYPESSPSEELAKEVAALKLLAIIESSEASGMSTSSVDDAVQWLADLVAEHEAGLWASILPHMYRSKYSQNLPSNWQELVENCPQIITERVVNGLIYLPNNEGSSLASFVDATYVAEDTIDSDLPPLQFPDDDFWNVYVTVANSSIEIWIRIIGDQYSVILDNLLQDMENYYKRSGTTVDKAMLIKNAWYAVHLTNGGWQRAKILEIEDEVVTVFLGDHGDDDVVDINMIKILEPQFRKLPAQAVLCRLEGLEELSAHALGGELVSARLLGESLVAAPGARPDVTDPAVPLVLYDTSTQRDLNLNREIVHDFCIAGAFALTPKLCEVEVGCVTEEGQVWVQNAGGAALVRAALAMLTAGPYRRPLPSAPPAPPASHPPGTPQPLYIVRTIDGDWVRCAIISGLDGEGTVRTQLVDSGLILRAPLSSLVPLQAFSMALNEFPPQAMLASLERAERQAGSMVGRLRELLLGACVLCRGGSRPPGAGAPQRVELFVRTGPQNILASVNHCITIEYDYLQTSSKEKKEEKPQVAVDHVEALNKKKERVFRSLSGAGGAGGGGGATGEERLGAGTLPPPALPAPGKCFDVSVAMAANPWNFVVQPSTTSSALSSMMSSLQRECPKMSADEAPLNPASGELYTVLYEKDAMWYRVLVAGCVSNEMVSVYFCDFGDLALFANSQLRPVPAAVPLARSLPPQALKARLHDVCPLHQDWTVEDCVRFQELCVEQMFVAICMDVGKDPLNPNEPLLTIQLIDTSTDDDFYINKQLVKEGRARLVSAS